jgi:hypothetical protein
LVDGATLKVCLQERNAKMNGRAQELARYVTCDGDQKIL